MKTRQDGLEVKFSSAQRIVRLAGKNSRFSLAIRDMPSEELAEIFEESLPKSLVIGLQKCPKKISLKLDSVTRSEFVSAVRKEVSSLAKKA